MGHESPTESTVGMKIGAPSSGGSGHFGDATVVIVVGNVSVYGTATMDGAHPTGHEQRMQPPDEVTCSPQP